MEGEQEAWRGQGCELPANHHQLITFTGSPAEGSAEGSGGRTITGDLLRGPAQRGAESPAHRLPGNDGAGPPARQTQTLCSGLCIITGLTCVGACPHGLLGGAPTHGVCPPQSDASLCGNQRHKDAGPGDRSHSSPGPTAAPGEPSAHPSSLQRPGVQKWGSKMGVTTELGLEHEDKSSHISRELLRVRLSTLPVKTPDHPKMARSK